jgi:hypothetical protein
MLPTYLKYLIGFCVVVITLVIISKLMQPAPVQPVSATKPPIYIPPAPTATNPIPVAPKPTPVPAPVPAPITKTVYGNNGTVSCATYCAGTGGKPWNNELPVDWNGALCVSSSIGTCTQIPRVVNPTAKSVVCVCKPDPNKKGWFI